MRPFGPCGTVGLNLSGQQPSKAHQSHPRDSAQPLRCLFRGMYSSLPRAPHRDARGAREFSTTEYYGRAQNFSAKFTLPRALGGTFQNARQNLSRDRRSSALSSRDRRPSALSSPGRTPPRTHRPERPTGQIDGFEELIAKGAFGPFARIDAERSRGTGSGTLFLRSPRQHLSSAHACRAKAELFRSSRL